MTLPPRSSRHASLRWGSALTALCILLFFSTGLLARDWPRFLGPEGTGVSRETGLLEKWLAGGPPRLWTRTVGTGYSAPSVLGDRLVLHHRVGDEEVVECMEAGSGKRIWRHTYPSNFIDPFGYNNGPRCTPLLTPEFCYTFGAEGKLVCLDMQSGALIWERNTSADWNVPEAFFGVGSTPLLEGNLLIVMVGGQPNSGVVAFDARTGRTVWENVGETSWDGVPMTGWPGERTVAWRRHDKQASYASPVLATLHGKRHLLCLMRQGLVSLDPATGQVHFSFWFRARVEESVNAANPIVLDDRILLSGAYQKVGSVLLQVKPDGQGVEEVWRDPVLEIHWTTPILHDGFVYAFSGRNEPDARFRCVELKTGKLMWSRDERWRRSFDRPDTYGRGSAILADGKLIVLGESGLLGLFRVNPEQPEELSRFQVPELQYPCWTAPILADRKLYLRSEGHLLCLDLARGQKSE